MTVRRNKQDSSNDKRSVAVIGAGPAGIACALRLARAGVSVDLFESSNAVGGMAKSFKIWNRIVDLGPHRFFSSIVMVNNFWLDLAKGAHHIVNRQTRIYYNRCFFEYPLQPINAVLGLGVINSLSCVLSYLYRLAFPKKNEKSFEGWVVNRFGDKLFNTFFKSYSEKLWGISCAELDAEFAAQRIKKFSLFEAIFRALWRSSSTKHKTLVDQFVYPNNGCGQIYLNGADELIALGSRVHLNSRVINIQSVTRGYELVIKNNSKEVTQVFEYVVSSMPINSLVEKLSPPKVVKNALSKLKYRNTILCYIEVDAVDLFSDQWLYLHSTQVMSGRVTNFNNWDIKSYDTTILCFEYWCNEDDALWNFPSAKMRAVVESDFLSLGFGEKKRIINFKAIRIPKSYPLYSAGYKTHLDIVYKFIATFTNLDVIGRYGSFKYNNQDHSILMGLLAADKILGTSKIDVLSVNEGDEYQESQSVYAGYQSTGQLERGQ